MRTNGHTDPWTAREIAIVSDSAKSLEAMVHETGRSYWAVATKRHELGVTEKRYHPSHRAPRAPGATLCACATLDQDHESWCPSA